jgi:glycerate dehydrogenase
MKITVLDRASMGCDISFDELKKLGDTEIFESTGTEELYGRCAESDVLVFNKVKITRDLMEKCRNLKLLCVFATGYDNIDVTAAKERGIAVCNVPAYSTDSVTLCTVANVLYLFTHLREYNEHVVSGKYVAEGKANALTPVYHEIAGKTWGIIGYGNIGKSVAKVAKALGANVIVCKRTPTDEAVCVDLKTLCEKSDIITIHCPLNIETRGLISKEMIAIMKPSVLIVNEARGAVTDEEAIAEAIINGSIAAFGSDVFSSEPFDENHPMHRIMGLKNVCLTPHCAWGAFEARERCLRIICDNIKAYIDGKIQNRVDI